MLDVTVICVGRLKEQFYISAAAEYIKRLGAYCKITVRELPEIRRPQNPSPAETAAAMKKEAAAIMQAIPRPCRVTAMCIEGKELSSEELAEDIAQAAGSGISRLCFIIGGSDGLDDEIKKASDTKMSMSRMTFPHHLARIMLLEQLYRAFSIQSGGKYHK